MERSVTQLDRLRAELVADVSPVKPVNPVRLAFLGLLGSGLGAVLMLVFLGVRPGFVLSGAEGWAYIAAMSLGVISMFATMLAGIPGRLQRMGEWLAFLVMASGVILLMFGLPWNAAMSLTQLGDSALNPGFHKPAFVCGAVMGLMAVVPFIGILVLSRTMLFTRPWIGYGLMIVASMMWGQVVISAHCPGRDTLHILFGHGLYGLIVLIVATVWLAMRRFRNA